VRANNFFLVFFHHSIPRTFDQLVNCWEYEIAPALRAYMAEKKQCREADVILTASDYQEDYLNLLMVTAATQFGRIIANKSGSAAEGKSTNAVHGFEPMLDFCYQN
jgi:hypothetical protein